MIDGIGQNYCGIIATAEKIAEEESAQWKVMCILRCDWLYMFRAQPYSPLHCNMSVSMYCCTCQLLVFGIPVFKRLWALDCILCVNYEGL